MKEVTRSVARVTEISAESPDSFEDAVRVGMERATQTLRNVKSAWIKEQQVLVHEGEVAGYRVDMLVTFVLDDGMYPEEERLATVGAVRG
jgi:flavin-binding protein dodecin